MNPRLKILNKNIQAILISNPINIKYFVGDFGFSENERDAFLLITKNKKILATDKRYSENIKNNLEKYRIYDLGAINFIKTELKTIINSEKIKTIGIEENDLKLNEYKLLSTICKTTPINASINRIIKNNYEIKQIRKACQIGDQTFEYAAKCLQKNITEIELQKKIESYILNKNADISFKPIVAFGKNSSIPHHLSGNDKLKINQIVLIDFGVKINGYCSDMTRTIFFGNKNEKFEQIYKIVKESQSTAINFVNKNKLKKINLSDIDKVARNYIQEQGFETIPHSLGHGIGLEVHESPHVSPSSKDIMKNNMVFSIEPGIYIKNYGGIRIEDLVLVRNNKLELISHANREIMVIHD